MQLKYSFIIPVYNRPDEIQELLHSMTALLFDREYEIVIIEDGSTVSCEQVVDQFRDKLSISYFQKPNSGPGDSRNYGLEKAKGNYFLILDSDVILPQNYLKEVDAFLSVTYFDCFGGPDAADHCFTNLQKAINYAMTSLLTTGGIRGRKNSVGKFQPRSFNMGLSLKAFKATGGFGFIHPGEDPDLSLRLEDLGFKTTLIPNAVVYHKRRISWKRFQTQVSKFGKVRPILNIWHPGSAKITYWFPTLFIIGLSIAALLFLAGSALLIFLYLIYFGIIGLDAAIKNKSFNIGIAAILATFIQFWGYGTGFLISVWKLHFQKLDPESAFPELFFNDIKKD